MIFSSKIRFTAAKVRILEKNIAVKITSFPAKAQYELLIETPNRYCSFIITRKLLGFCRPDARNPSINNLLCQINLFAVKKKLE